MDACPIKVAVVDVRSLSLALSLSASLSPLFLSASLRLSQSLSVSFLLSPSPPLSLRIFPSIYGQGSQKLYNWQNIVSPPHYRNDVHHPHDIICLYCRGLQDESEYIYFYIVYVSHLSSIDEYCRTFGSNTVILACLQTSIAHSNLLHKKSINCNQTI